MSLLTTSSITLFKNLTEINEGFRIPDKAYVHGKDFVCFEQLGGDLYFSNYWYGKKEAAQEFAQTLAEYFQGEYKNAPVEEGDYDFYGMVMIWDLGDNAVVGSINLNEDIAFWGYDSGVPEELEKPLKKSKLKPLLSDGDDNTVLDLLYADCTKKIKKELFGCVAESHKEDYRTAAKEEGINITL